VPIVGFPCQGELAEASCLSDREGCQDEIGG
jgi:hypothetical protein